MHWLLVTLGTDSSVIQSVPLKSVSGLLLDEEHKWGRDWLEFHFVPVEEGDGAFFILSTSDSSKTADWAMMGLTKEQLTCLLIISIISSSKRSSSSSIVVDIYVIIINHAHKISISRHNYPKRAIYWDTIIWIIL